ncbi:epidermal differentiation-specific protein-like [Rhineura floridana]|uniref:epidermal differentiation-specific protein-like n=1 Tax=Rhineura floridana TaxID=261503 RepID=UPI002AC82554|nr:epidermal differentiation-specific protein-like [Rhineura floridana]XP_061478069.1 epidermal differentiation-specific protein-like [Rhineura floridana]XP_061478070.1 epidermal differentiation-specific protein-like [Rhineura floridana]XP_061478071.1 epidermal differentiation-specific protein-like [Rhineura floridana]XP_061478072.1 epidermal differentiation-specific protein-like [Rhineura floridana]
MSSRTSSMNKIIVYDKSNFEGLSKEFTCDIPDLHELDFGDCISSLKVIGQPWVAYKTAKFEGDGFAFEEGDYGEIDKSNKISSLRMVHHDLSDPQITLYEHPNYEGQSKVVNEETNLTYGYFNDRVSSHVVQSGVWLLYKHPNRGGWYHIAWPEERIHDYKTELNFDDSVSHLQPLQAGRPIITAKLMWDQKKVEAEKDILIDEIVGTNCTEYEQAFTANSSREYTATVFQSFHFSNTTSLKLGFSFQVTVGGANVFVVEKGKHECTTTSEKVEVLLPAKIPPCTQLCIQVVRKETTTSVPVELTICQNGKERKEHAEYRCVSGRTISTRYTMKPVSAAQDAPQANPTPVAEAELCHARPSHVERQKHFQAQPGPVTSGERT